MFKNCKGPTSTKIKKIRRPERKRRPDDRGTEIPPGFGRTIEEEGVPLDSELLESDLGLTDGAPVPVTEPKRKRSVPGKKVKARREARELLAANAIELARLRDIIAARERRGICDLLRKCQNSRN